MNSFDVVVMGAGVIGTSVAYHLAKKGMKVAMGAMFFFIPHDVWEGYQYNER